MFTGDSLYEMGMMKARKCAAEEQGFFQGAALGGSFFAGMASGKVEASLPAFQAIDSSSSPPKGSGDEGGKGER